MKKLILFYLIAHFLSVNSFAGEILNAYEKYYSDHNHADFLQIIQKYKMSEYFRFLERQNKDDVIVQKINELEFLLLNKNEETEDFNTEIINHVMMIEQYQQENFKDSEKSLKFLLITISILIVLIITMTLVFIKKNARLTELEKIRQKEQVEQETLIRVQESERQRIYQELHDTIVQDIRVNISKLREISGFDSILKTEEKNLETIKNIINNLTPPELTGIDFKLALQDLCYRLKKQSSLDILFYAEPSIDYNRLNDNQKLNVYRIVQEAIINAIKHSKASEVSVILKKSNSNKIQIFITDDGCGFENAAPESRGTGFGIKGMKSRASSIGGNIDIFSDGESGTEVRLEF